MDFIIEGILTAFKIIISLDAEFLGIVFTSIKVSLASIFISAMVAIPLGIWVGVCRFKGRSLITTILNTLMSFPTVLIGLIFYSLLSRRGPFGELGLLFTQTAMIIGQAVLAFPVIAALVSAGVNNLGNGAFVAARLLGAGRIKSGFLYLREAKFIVITSVLAAFGRVFSEIGISMMLGGNIRFYTRNITTAIALETSRGAFGLGIALGLVLLLVAFMINIIACPVRERYV
ncbi:ABC transporter permease [Candidatus Omnitrophota bacterium]